MKKGWVSICESEHTQPLQTIKLLESEVEVPDELSCSLQGRHRSFKSDTVY